MADPVADRARLERRLHALAPLAVAVSGGVDSMTLAVVARRALGDGARMVHAVSPAVPPQATERVRRHAAAGRWRLAVIDAGEFADERYRANPVDRCFYCKTSLYGAMARRVDDAVIVSGTNLDDLGDYRPGLRAAEQHGVRHPFVEAGIDKSGVRAIARALGLDDLAELPAAPCLSSRVETGIAIEANVLEAIDDVERMLASTLSPRTVRCRVRRGGVVVELDDDALAALDDDARTRLGGAVAQRFAGTGAGRAVAFAPYRMGSAFLRPRADG